MSITGKTATKCLIAAAVFAVSAFLGWMFGKNRAEPIAGRGVIIRQGGYELISPILSCEIGDKDTFREIKPLENTLADAIKARLYERKARDVSLYLRMMNSGRWLGIDEEKEYAPASLSKVLIMVGYFKVSETNPEELERTVIYNGKYESDEVGENAEKLETGKTYTVRELIRRMIVYSSNPAMNLILDNINQKTLAAVREVYSDLNIAYPAKLGENKRDFMSVKAYSLLFRVLYGATYMGREKSHEALKMLIQTDFKDGLVAGVPESVKVAHKYGAALTAGENGVKEKELHDCGIVYYPGHPYLICVMTRGEDYDKLKEVIANISALAYKAVDKFFKSN